MFKFSVLYQYGKDIILHDKLTPNPVCRASISVSMPACHAGEQGSTPWRGVERHPAQNTGSLTFLHMICALVFTLPAKASLNKKNGPNKKLARRN